MLTIAVRIAVFLAALWPLSAAGQVPAGRITQIDAVSVAPDRFEVLLEISMSV